MSDGVLSQEEIDALLAGISIDPTPKFTDIKSLESFLLDRRTPDIKSPYGIFESDVTMCRFFETGNNESILEDIRQKNIADGMGNIVIPHTNITLINFSYCLKCKTVYSFQDLDRYYKNPTPDRMFKNKGHQFRNDTRVHCHVCGEYFLPAIIISDGTPRKEQQFLCRAQTANAIEEFMFIEKGKLVLTRKASNIIINTNGNVAKAILNDVLLSELGARPTLISNLIQYTPANMAMNLVSGMNVRNKDFLFGICK